MTYNELINLFERIRYQLVAFPYGAQIGVPTSVGSSFMLDYKGYTFLMTADHVVNTHDKGVRRLDKTVAIQTNRLRIENGRPECELVGLTNVEFFSQFNVNLNTGDVNPMPLFDAAYSILSEDTLAKSFVTPQIDFNDVSINAGTPKQHLQEACITMPSADKEYCVFGRIKFRLENIEGVNVLWSELTFKKGLKFIGEKDGYYLLKSPIDFVYEDWAGLSGSAVLDTDGNLIGIACAVKVADRIILVKKIQLLLPLMQASIMQIEHPEIMTPPAN